MTPPIDFLVRMRKLDRSKLTPRDVVLMWAIREIPGIMGRELAMKVGVKTRSAVQFGIARLIRRGLIEDRRVKLHNLTPNDLHITAAGVAFLEDLVPRT